MTDSTEQCKSCGQDLVVEEKCTFHGDWYCVCVECDAVVDYVEPNDEPLDIGDATD